MMNSYDRGSKHSSPKSNSSRQSSPTSQKQASNPSSPEEGQVTQHDQEHQGLHRKYTGRSSAVNFMTRNRKAVQAFYKRTGVPGTPGEPSEGTGSSQPRTKVGQAPSIGDELGTPSNKGSSFFLSASHNGVREPHKRVIAPKKHQNSDS